MEQDIKNQQPLMVTIRCIAYNQEAYIRDCLEGFVMQKTNFRFEAIVHDDASTDGTAAIIKEYAEKYPDIIKPILETENQYSKHDGSLGRIMDEHTHGKYVAYCEGDDYWIDPLKLQKQVDFLESHPDYSMCWTNAFKEFNNGREAFDCYPESCQSPMEDIIERGGGFIPTCSIVLRKQVLDKMPYKMRTFFVGDYPLQMWCGWSGKCWYLEKPFVVYRLMSQGSWTHKNYSQKNMTIFWRNFNGEKKIIDVCNQIFEFQYNESFEKHAANNLYNLCMIYKQYKLAVPYFVLRKKYGYHVGKAELMYIKGYPFLGKILELCIKVKHLVKKYYGRFNHNTNI